MADQDTKSPIFDPPELHRRLLEPKGVLQKNLKIFIYLGAALLVIVAAIFSSGGKKTSSQQAAAKGQPPQPALQDNTDNNVADLKSQLQAEQVKEQQQAAAAAAANDPALAGATPAQQAAARSYGPTGQPIPCVAGQPCQQPMYGQQSNGQQQLSPERQQAQQLAAKERELAFHSRFASNLAYSRPADPPPQQQQTTQGGATPTGYASQQNPYASSGQPRSSLIAPRAAGDPPSVPTDQASIQRGPEVNIDSAMGQPYVIYEGLTMDTVLMNRLDGDAVGPVKVLVSNSVYSHDHQHVLVPDGTIVLGEARKIGASGFGQQRRLAVVFHRMIMPDGYSVDLDQFHGLDQIGFTDIRNVHRSRRYCWSGRDDARGRNIQWLGFATVYERSSIKYFSVGNDNPRSLHPNTTDHHDPRRASGEGLFHAGLAASCVHQSHHSPNLLGDVMKKPIFIIAALLGGLAFSGCQSKQEKLSKLQAEYNARLATYTSDCYGLALDQQNKARVAKCKAESRLLSFSAR